MKPLLLGAAAGILFAACVGATASRSTGAFDPCTYRVNGACVVFDQGALYVVPRSRVQAAVDKAVAYWGAKKGDLKGWTIVFQDTKTSFVGVPIWGTTSPSLKRVDVHFMLPTCPEVVLIHELGHALDLNDGGDGRPHNPWMPDTDDARFKDEAILALLVDVPGCTTP